MSVWAVIGKILLIILQVLGWTIVGILGLILLVLLLVFFFPILYKVEASGDSQSKDYQASARVHTLLRLVSADVRIQDKKLEGVLRIAWIRKQLFGEKKEEKAPEEPVQEATSTADAATEPDVDAVLEPNTPEEPATVETPEPQTAADEVAAEQISAPVEEPPEAPAAEPEPETEEEPEPTAEEKPKKKKKEKKEKKSKQEKLEQPKYEPVYDYTAVSAITGREVQFDASHPLLGKAFQTWEQTEEKVQGVTEKIDSTLESIEEKIFKVESLYHKYMDYPDRSFLTWLLIRQLRKLLRNIRPREFQLNGIYGLDSPVTTGKIAAAYAMLSCMTYGISRYEVDLTPDFEEKIFAGSLYCKGNLQAYMILFPVLRLAISPRVWKLIKFIRKK